MDNEQAYVHMVRARNAMLFTNPFFGSLVMNLRLVETTNEGFNTAATNGKVLYYNPEYINKLFDERGDNEYNKSLVAHEALHCVFSHMTRLNGRNHMLWNIACDYVVNLNLKESGFVIHDTWLYNEDYKDWTSEQIYDDLMKNLKFSKDGIPLNLPGSGGSSLADHHPGDEEFPDNPADAGEEELSYEELEEKWKDALVSAYEAGKDAGNIPGSIIRHMKKFTKPKIKWHEVLRNKVSEYMKSDYTWMKPNRRFFGSGIMLPSTDKVQKISLGVAIDTSGSISKEDLQAFMSEINSIVTMYHEFEINVACFDTSVKSIACLKNQDDFEEYIGNLEGGGGTDFGAWWNWALNEEWYNDAQAVVFFTDGYPGGEWLPDEAIGTKDIYWVVKGSQNEGPVGTTLFYDD